MSIHVHLHSTHRPHAGGQPVVEVEGKTVGDCLHHLIRRYPGMEKELFDRGGKLLAFLQIFVNDESAYPEELRKPVSDGDAIYLTIFLGGG